MSEELTAKQRQERLERRQRALGRKMRKQGESILDVNKAVNVNATDIKKTFERLEEEKIDKLVESAKVVGTIHKVKK